MEPTIIAEVEQEVSSIQTVARQLIIETKENFEFAGELLHNVKKVKALVTERKEDITRPLMKSLASARDLFRPFEEGYANAEKIIKSKMLEYTELVNVDEAKKELANRISNGEISATEAMDQIEALGEMDGKTAKSSIRMVRKVRVLDEALIPREYMVPDMARITQAILREGAVIPGIETYDEKTIVSR